MRISFTKMTGAGNDFVVIDNRVGTIRAPARLARWLCDRRWGVGADGLLLLERSSKADYRMKYFNADGSYGGMCGNGGRCIALYATLKGIAPREHSFDALNYVYRAKVHSRKNITLWMKNPVRERASLIVKTQHGTAFGDFVDTGAPHFVAWGSSTRSRWRNLESIDVEHLGRAIRLYSAFQPEGTNANFARLTAEGRVEIRTYERGVEAETHACGTGSIAAAVSAAKRYKLASPVSVLVRSGSILEVGFKEKDDRFIDIRLTGPAQVIFEGSIDG